MILVLSILVASKKSRPQSTYLISLWCSFRQMPSSRHSAPRAACWNILPEKKDFSTVLKPLCNLVLNSASALLEVPLHLVQLLLPTLQHWLMAGIANEEGEDGLAVEQHVDNQVDIKQVTWSPGRPPPRPTWPPLSPRRLCGGALWRERLLWSEGIRWEKCIWWRNHFNPLNLFVLVHYRHCQRYQVFILFHHQGLPKILALAVHSKRRLQISSSEI